MQHSMLRTALILGLLSAVGPFSIDMYLPALPLIEVELNTTVAGAQTTLTAFFIAFGLSQLVYGPWADQAGRRIYDRGGRCCWHRHRYGVNSGHSAHRQ